MNILRFSLYERLSSLANDFVHVAKRYGHIIISEAYLPNDKKPIRPIDIGGRAGSLINYKILQFPKGEKNTGSVIFYSR